MSKTRMGKRIASLLLSLVMMLSLLPTTVYATTDAADENGVSVVGSTAPDAAQEGVDNAAAGEGDVGDVGENGDVSEDGGDAADSALTTQSGDTEMLGTYAAGETDTSVAAIGETKYATLAEAVEEAENGQTVKLLSNVELTGCQTIDGKKLTIDLSGFDISLNKDFTAIWLKSGNLTIQDTSEDSAGVVSGGGSWTISVDSDATLTVKSGNIKGWTAVKNCGTVNIEGTANLEAAAGYGVDCQKDSTVIMTGGTVDTIGPIRDTADSTVKISGGKVTNYAYATEVTGGEFNILVLLTSGTIKGAVINGKFEWKCAETPTLEGVRFGDNATVRNEGYCFNSDKSAIVPSVAKIGDTEYATLPEAIKAATTGATIVLLENITLSSAQSISSKKLTLDLNGKTLSSTAYQTIQLNNAGADLTVKDGASGGKIANEYKGSAYPATIYLNAAGTKFTLESGTIESDPNKTSLQSVAINSENGKACEVNIKGGSVTVVPEAATKGRAIVASTNSMTLNISGGTITGGWYGVDAYSGSNVNITGGEITARVVDTGVIKETYGMRIIGTANVTVAGGEITGVKMDDNGYNPDVPNVTLKSGTINGSFYSVSKGTIVFNVAEDAEITFANDTVKKFLPDTVELVKTPAGTYGVAKAKVYVAKIGDVQYETLKEAIDAANTGGTITLLDDVNLGTNGQYLYSTAPDKKNVCNLTFDLNGHKITSSSTSYTVSASREGLVIKNGTITNESDKTGPKTCAVYVTGAGTTTFENVTLSAKGSGVYVSLNHGEAIVNVETGTSISGKYGVYLQGATGKSTYNGKETLNVNDGKITGTAAGVHVVGPGSGSKSADDAAVTVNVTGGEVSSVTTVSGNSNRAAAVIISGGTVTGDLKNAGKDVITITDGTFKGAVTKLDTNGTIAISGGTFAIKPDTTYLVEGYTITENADKTYGVAKAKVNVAKVGDVQYETLQAAIDAASRKTTVTMLADTRENVTISTSDLTLDLNGHTLNGGTVAGKPALTVTASVTVKDSSEKQTGTIMREDTAENSGVSSHYVIDVQGNGWLTFEGGNVKNNSGIVGVTGASLVRVGDDSVAEFPGLNIKGGTFTQDNFIVIKVDRGDLFLNGGTLSSKNSYAIENWHRATVKGGTVNGTVAAWTYSGGQKSDLTISGGTVNGDVTSVNYGNAEDRTATVTITGGIVNGQLDTRSYDPATGELTHSDDATKATIKITSGTFSSDPTKYVVEASTVKTNADGTFGVEKAYLATVGETSYYTMDEAFKAQTTSGEAIVLLRDYTTGGTFNSGSINRTVDLNEHTWTCTGTDANSAAFEINYSNVTLTVKNGKVVSSQLVGLIPSAMGGTIKYDNSGLVFEGVEMSTTATSGIETNGNNTNDTVTLRNSTLNVPNGFGIYFPSSGTLTIENSKINAKTMGVQVCSGSLSINAGSAITVSGDAVPKTENDGAIQDGAAISIVNRNGYKGLGEIAVTGGKFTAKTGNAAIKAYNWNDADKKEATFTESTKVAVSGGTFSSIPDNMDGLCKDGFIPVKNADGYAVQTGTYVASIGTKKFATLAEAVEAAKDGDTVKLLADVEQNARLVINKSITLDLSGKKICNTKDIWNESNALIGIGTDETRVQVTITGNGTIKAKENDCYTIDVKNGDLTIENGEFIGNVSAVQVQTGTLTIKDGKFSLLQKWDGKSTYLINCIDGKFADGSAKVAIYGGTFEGFDPNVSPEKKVDGKAPSFAAEGVGITKSGDNFTACAGKAIQILDENDGSIDWYSSLVSALYWVKKGYTVRLLQDYVEDSRPEVKDEVTIDGQGKYSITVEDNSYSYITVSSGKLALSDVTITGMSNTYSLLYVEGTAAVTIDKDSSIIANGSEPAIFLGSASDTDSATPTVNIYGRVEGETADYLIAGNGSYEGTSYINIYDDAVVKAGKLAMFLPQLCEVNITGGTVEGACAIGIKSGTLNITGGQVLGVAENNELSDNNSVGSGMRYDGSAIVIDSHTGYKGDVKINISGSAFIQSRCSTGIREIGDDAAKTNVTGLSISGGTVLSGGGKDAVQVREVTKNIVSITGGSFSTNVADYCASDYQCNMPTEDEPLYTVTKKNADEIDVKRSLTLDNSLTMNYKVKLPSGYTSARVEFKFYNDYTKAFETATVTGVLNESTGRYESAFTGINPQRMTDTLKATVYATNVDTQEETAFPVDDFSAAQYCNVLLASDYNKEGAYNELVGNLVAYGTAAQLYQKYHTDKLVSSVVTGGTVVQYPLTDVTEVNGLTAVAGGVSIEKKSLVLSNAFAIRVKFALEGDTTIDQVTFKVEVDTTTATISQFEKETLSDGTVYYYFDFAGLNSKQLGSTVTFTAVVDGNDNDVLAFSANTYLKLMSNVTGVSTELKNLLAALYNYGYTCKNFEA